MDMIGVRRVRGRDLATGIVLGAAIGLSALFLYLDTTTGATTGATQQILFGSIFTIDQRHHPGRGDPRRDSARLHRGRLAAAAAGHGEHLISPPRGESRSGSSALLYMLALAVSVGLSSLAVGAILSTALLIGPAATALRLTRRVGRAVAAACLIGVGATWLGILLAYDSYYWGAATRACRSASSSSP